MAGAFAWKVLILCTLGCSGCLCRKAALPRLQLKFPDLIQSQRMAFLPINATDLHSVVLDEERGKLYVALNDDLLSASLYNITSEVKTLHWPATQGNIQQCQMAGKDLKLDCANFLRVLHIYNHTHLFACGTGAFHPRCAFINTDIFHKDEAMTLGPEQTVCGKGKCPYDPQQHVATALIDGELYAGISSDFMSRDAGFFRGLGHRHVMRTEQYDSRWLQDPKFVKVQKMAESDNEEDDKIYLFFTERAQEAESGGGKVIYSRVSRVCKNDIGGQRSLVNKWSTFLKARMVCSIPGPEGIQTHFDELKDIFILNEKDRKNAKVYGVFTTSSNILNGSAVCVYNMEDIASAFKGQYAHKESPDFKWLPYQGRIPFPRPGTCPSSTHGNYRSTRDYPDDVMFFSRTHPLMYNVIYPTHRRPILVRVGVDYKFTKIVIDRVEGVNGQYDIMFIGTDKGMVFKTTHFPGANQKTEEIFLEEFEVFQDKSTISSLLLDRKKLKVSRILIMNHVISRWYQSESEDFSEPLFRGRSLVHHIDIIIVIGDCIDLGVQQVVSCCIYAPARPLDPQIKHWLYIASKSGLSQLAVHQCEMYGKVCAECCLARDPYCTWDGASCSRYEPNPRRRNARQVSSRGNPLMECLKHGVPLQANPEEKLIVVAEGNGTFLECLPKSRHATVTWVRIINETNWVPQKISPGDHFIPISQGMVIRQAEPQHAGTYHCQIEEEGFQWTLLKVHLMVIPVGQALTPREGKVKGHSKERSSNHHPWYKDLMNLINYPSKMDFYCEQIWQRESRKKKNKVGPEISSERRRSEEDSSNISAPLSIKGLKNHKLQAKSLRSPRST